jgi:protein-S-isoprenylcysteine O-methyltransferase Ste14
MRRPLVVLAILVVAALAIPAAALAHDAPENDESKWVMADWMLDMFFVLAGVALVAFVLAWKAGHFHNLDEAARVPLAIDEEDYYTPDWARDEEEWDDGAPER